MIAAAPMKQTRTAVAVLAGAIILGSAGSASALDVPPFRGNDTGGIIAYEYATQTDVRALTTDHCGRYNKVPKLTGADRRYGGYISFTCVWARAGSYALPLRTLY